MKEREEGEASVRILVSVPKKCFKRAVKRNRVKRQVREAYRKNKKLIDGCMLQQAGKTLLLALIWLDERLYDSRDVEQKVQSLLVRISEKICQ